MVKQKSYILGLGSVDHRNQLDHSINYKDLGYIKTHLCSVCDNAAISNNSLAVAFDKAEHA